MSYDIYSYRPDTAEPNLLRAQEIVECEEEIQENEVHALADLAEQERAVAALLAFNPRLTRFQMDFAAIAKLKGLSESEARARFTHVELNPPEGDYAIQLTVNADHVFFAIPYWYKREDAERVFEQLGGYLKVLRDAVGYFAYDPQAGTAFDPSKMDRIGLSEYLNMVEQMPSLLARVSKPKPWWRFW